MFWDEDTQVKEIPSITKREKKIMIGDFSFCFIGIHYINIP